MAAVSLPTLASTDNEREQLANLLSELQLLEQWILQAEKAADPSDRQRFNYAALRADLALIKQGINKHLFKPRVDPRPLLPLAPLTGDYD